MAASVDSLISAAFLADLQSVPVQQLRDHRAACEDVEVALSYVRRIVHGRLDIAYAGSGAVDRLPEILADPSAAEEEGVSGRPALRLSPGEVPADLAAALDDAVGVEELLALERRVSDLRRALHGTIDALQDELVRRYKSGEANVDSLLT